MIETKRLMLMKISSGDLEVISKILSSPTQTKFLPNQAPYSDEHQREYLFNRIEHWSKYGFGTFVVALKEDPIVKVGFVGAEYAKSLVTWFFDNTQHSELYGVAMANNFGSKSVLSKIGMEPVKGVNLYDCKELESFCLRAINTK